MDIMKNTRNYVWMDIDAMGNPKQFVDGKAHHRFGYERSLMAETNPTLLANFNKVAKWVEENCPHLNGIFKTPHDPYHWVQLNVENGKAYLEHGSHGYGYSLALSTTETAVFSRGSMQCSPYAFEGKQFCENRVLEEFLSNWQSIKREILAKNATQSLVFSENFSV